MYDAPKGPSLRPKNPAHKEPINGKKTSRRYIKNCIVINYVILIIFNKSKYSSS